MSLPCIPGRHESAPFEIRPCRHAARPSGPARSMSCARSSRTSRRSRCALPEKGTALSRNAACRRVQSSPTDIEIPNARGRHAVSCRPWMFPDMPKRFWRGVHGDGLACETRCIESWIAELRALPNQQWTRSVPCVDRSRLASSAGHPGEALPSHPPVTDFWPRRTGNVDARHPPARPRPVRGEARSARRSPHVPPIVSNAPGPSRATRFHVRRFSSISRSFL